MRDRHRPTSATSPAGGGAWKAYIPGRSAAGCSAFVVDRLAERLDSALDGVVIYLEVSWVVFGWLVISSSSRRRGRSTAPPGLPLGARHATTGSRPARALPRHPARGARRRRVGRRGRLHVVLVQVAWPLLWVAVVRPPRRLGPGRPRRQGRPRVGRAHGAAAGGLLGSSTHWAAREVLPRRHDDVDPPTALRRVPALTIAVPVSTCSSRWPGSGGQSGDLPRQASSRTPSPTPCSASSTPSSLPLRRPASSRAASPSCCGCRPARVGLGPAVGPAPEPGPAAIATPGPGGAAGPRRSCRTRHTGCRRPGGGGLLPSGR